MASAESSAAPSTAKGTVHNRLMYLQVTLCGAVVMLVEILGTRIIGPVFGVGLFVWSALLSITLFALAVGYFVGGVVADRAAKGDWLSNVMVGAGLFLSLSTLLRFPTLSIADGLGLKAGPVVAAFVLFFPTLTCLGMVAPLAIKRSTQSLTVTGRRVGWIYALSTAGSLVGTFTVGFFLIPNFSVNVLVVSASAALIVGGLVPLVTGGSRRSLLAVVAPLLAMNVHPRAMPPGFVSVERHESLLGMVEVIDDNERNVRLLRMDHSIIGGQFVNTHASAFAFLHVIEAFRFARPQSRSVLQIGLGAGSVPMALKGRDKVFDVVEIDPAIVDMAKRHFSFVPNGEVVVDDARAFLNNSSKKFDVVIHDTFSGGTSPEHLFSREMLLLIKRRLASNGLLVLNFVGFARGPNLAATLSVRSTLRAQFAHVRAFKDSAPAQDPDDVSNLVFFASDSPITFSIPPDAEFESPECADVARAFEKWEMLSDAPAGPEITDAKNPLAQLQSPIVAAHYEGMKQLLPKSVWVR